MNKILNYISNGRGAGLKWFSFYTLTVCILCVVFIGNIFTKILMTEPIVQDFINKLPVMKIENGQLVEPADTFEVIPVADGLPYTITINTTNNIPVHLNMDGGFYLTKETVYVKQDAVADPIAMSFADIGDMVIDKPYLDSLIKRFASVWAMLIGLALFAMLWICLGLQVFILKILFFIFSRSVSVSICSRASMLMWIVLFTANAFLLSFGISLNMTVLFLGAVIATFLVISKAMKMPKSETKPKMFFDDIKKD